MDHKKRLDDFFAGKLSQQQAQELLDWLDSSEAEEFLSAEVLQVWSESIRKHSAGNWDSKPLWEKINRAKGGYSKPFLLTDQQSDKRFVPQWLKAAVVLLVLGISAVFYFELRKPGDPPAEISLESPRLILRENPAGQKTRINLPDGSTVFLNSESRITYSEDFLTNRKIELEGEGFFKVVRDEAHPFTVNAKGILTTALGTTFNISTFKAGDQVAVTLISGKVRLNQKGSPKSIDLMPGEESQLSLTSASLSKYEVETDDRVSWIEGILRFSETPFEEILPTLERWYGVRIQVSGDPGNIKATGTFEANESLRNVLHVLSASMDFSYKLNNKEVVINFN